MNVTVTKKQNVVVDGIKYKAVGLTLTKGCRECAFYGGGPLENVCTLAPCTAMARQDCHSVIFVKDKRQWGVWQDVGDKKPKIPDGVWVEWISAHGRTHVCHFPEDIDWGIGGQDPIVRYRLVKPTKGKDS